MGGASDGAGWRRAGEGGAGQGGTEGKTPFRGREVMANKEVPRRPERSGEEETASRN